MEVQHSVTYKRGGTFMFKAKKIIATITASVMAVSMMSVCVSADGCTHPSLVLRRTGVASTYTTTHTVYETVGSTVNPLTCTVTHLIHKLSYVCASCGSIRYSAGTEETENHSIVHAGI